MDWEVTDSGSRTPHAIMLLKCFFEGVSSACCKITHDAPLIRIFGDISHELYVL